VDLLAKGRNWLSILRRANHGSLKPFEKILGMTYGRTGRRRYELLDASNTPMLKTKRAPPEEATPGPKDAKRSPHWKPPAQMMALLTSQAKEEGYLIRNSKPRVKTPFEIPEKNIWGNPISERRRTNQLQKWYSRNSRGVLPPLPAQEYLQLLSIASGETQLPDIPKRRPVASSSTATATASATASQETDSLKKTASLIFAGPQTEKQRRLAAKSASASLSTSESTSSFDSATKANISNRRRRLSSRFIQRRLQRAVLQQTPLAHAPSSAAAASENADKSAAKAIHFSWQDGRSHDCVYKASLPTAPTGGRQTKLLFG